MDIYKKYLKAICSIYKNRDATEPSYYSALKTLFEDYAAQNHKDVDVIINPKKTEGGMPDFKLKTHGKLIGYVEAKDPKISPLEQIASTEQLERYRKTWPNVILTNFTDFILFRKSKEIKTARVTQPVNLQLNKPVVHKVKEVNDFLDTFFEFTAPTTYKAQDLAIELANRTRLFASFTLEELKRGESNSLEQFYNAFKEELISDLSLSDFADMYAQTITYGLFSARMRAGDEEFTRTTAYQYIPSTIPLLRDLFYSLTGPDLPGSLEGIIDDIRDVLVNTEIKAILKEFHTTKWTDDPVIHFYETFLKEYEPKERKLRGVYYTPAPVVSYIVRSIHKLLKEKFGKSDGLVDSSVTLLDPAAGTLSFPATAVRLCKQELEERKRGGVFPALVKDHILKNFYAFELMVAPYAIGHLKISVVLEDLGYKLAKDERFKFYLTNTLERKEIKAVDMPFISSLAKEGKAAEAVKEKLPILVVLGNPPYSVSSCNRSLWMDGGKVPVKQSEDGKIVKYEYHRGLLDDYKDPVRGEKNIQPLSDDYIKFIRFAQWKIEQGGQGIVGLISNNSYLSGIIHRGMRKRLLDAFNEIYILNLHGSARIAEKAPDGSKDENVFDIQQGVAIALFVKNVEQGFSLATRVCYADLWGLREKKYKYLLERDVETTRLQKLKPQAPYYFFVPKDLALQAKYEKFWKVTDIFKKWSSGVKTHRDHFLVGFRKEEITQKLRIFTGKLSDELIKESLKLKNTRDWNLKEAREKARQEKLEDKIYPYAYKPYDYRLVCYELCLIDRGCDRWNLMRHLLKENTCIALMRRPIPTDAFTQVLAVNSVADINFYAYQTYFFPLYLYRQKENKKRKSNGAIMMVFEPEAKYTIREPNFSPEFRKSLASRYKREPTSEEIFYYIYAVLYSPIYRKRYEEFLKIDFPRIPFPSDYEILKKLSKLGKELVDIHLLKSTKLKKSPAGPDGYLSYGAGYPVHGSDKVEKVSHDEKNHRVYINKEQYFSNISEELWEYYIGAYQVLRKWLVDRKGLSLNLEDQEHYFKIVAAIEHTIKLQKEIDKVYSRVEKIST